MSTGLELIPIAIAIGAILSHARKPTLDEETTETYAIETRARDADLLGAAVRQHASNAAWHGARLVATVDGVPMNLVRRSDQASFEAVVPTTVPVATAHEVLLSLDGTYTGLVQQRVRERVLRDAAANGMAVTQERVEDDETIVLTLIVQEQA